MTSRSDEQLELWETIDKIAALLNVDHDLIHRLAGEHEPCRRLREDVWEYNVDYIRRLLKTHPQV